MSSKEGASAADDGDGKPGVTFNNLIEDSSMCLLLFSLWLCVVGVVLRNLYEECRVERKFSHAGVLVTALLIAIGGGYGAALAFNSYDERVDLVYIGYVTISGFTLTAIVMLVILAEFCWWKVWHLGDDWSVQGALDDEEDQPVADEAGTPRHGKLLGRSGSFNMLWVVDWVRGGSQPDRDHNSYKPMRDGGVELSQREKRGLEEGRGYDSS